MLKYNFDIPNRRCVICKGELTRKWKKTGGLESRAMFAKRQTCGYEWHGEKRRMTDCMRVYFTAERNPNYKGIMPKCATCGISISYTNKKGGMKTIKYCHPCWLKSEEYMNYLPIMIEANKKRGVAKRGRHPEALKPFAFKAGFTPHNKGIHAMRDKKIISIKQDGGLSKDIAVKFGISPSRVTQICND